MSLPSLPIFRFAPSPNGRLHLGHAYSALYTDHWARAMGGTMLLRIEDIDIGRCRPEFVEAIFDDLRWLGLDWPQPVRFQSHHFDDYQGAFARLKARDLVYPCFCTRAQIRAAGGSGTDPDGAPLYPGTCRHLAPEERERRFAAGERAQWRLDIEAALRVAAHPAIREAMPDPDSRPASRAADPARWGDVVLVRKDIPTSYHLSVVVDDALQGVGHVTRGMDLYAATDIHVLLQGLLGLPPPLYTHHRLVLDRDADKLSKSRRSESLGDLREKGWSAAAVRHHLGFEEASPRFT
ncbi:tRNA glutamyl-Q(34) synthetase GluQRS [Pelagibacterium lacus]|uniref:tRNA glutamyl-Q(34) synthetase GluQRS n=1 Tax=Pelagibacterium lacus TaxID=2282655 RepID=A0A369W434_9HYPH|nr:tRNA glutamyl-Q(34) synthetase GluQRS [Pelagibacterium lacus]RDE08799.1 tRNA glutamyl-Q(34) synthetase GluQRS [Pelagibacterium lacus]